MSFDRQIFDDFQPQNDRFWGFFRPFGVISPQKSLLAKVSGNSPKTKFRKPFIHKAFRNFKK